jgi:hypothetical protein
MQAICRILKFARNIEKVFMPSMKRPYLLTDDRLNNQSSQYFCCLLFRDSRSLSEIVLKSRDPVVRKRVQY